MHTDWDVPLTQPSEVHWFSHKWMEIVPWFGFCARNVVLVGIFSTFPRRKGLAAVWCWGLLVTRCHPSFLSLSAGMQNPRARAEEG